MGRFIPAILAACLLAVGPAASTPRTVAAAANVRPEEAHSWLAERRREIVSLRAGGQRADLAAGLAAAREAGLNLARTGGMRDRKLGYIIYPPRTTISLLLLDRLHKLYAAALHADSAREIPTVDELLRLAGKRLEPTVPAKYPSPRKVRAALDSMKVPPSAFRGYRVFLLPFAMGDVSGLGGAGVAFLAAEPAGESLIPCQIEVTLTHEFGHHLHLAGMPRTTPAGRTLWAKYLALRSLAWREDGPVGTAQWRRSPEETFAEDFRLLYGGAAARSEPSIVAAGDPWRDGNHTKLRRFMLELMETTEVPRHIEPWPEGDGVEIPGLAAALALAGAILLGFAAAKAIGRRGATRRSPPVSSSSWPPYP